MARRGVTQELIDDTRASIEVQMLRDLQKLASMGNDLEYKDHQGATPVCIYQFLFIEKIIKKLFKCYLKKSKKTISKLNTS